MGWFNHHLGPSSFVYPEIWSFALFLHIVGWEADFLFLEKQLHREAHADGEEIALHADSTDTGQKP